MSRKSIKRKDLPLSDKVLVIKELKRKMSQKVVAAHSNHATQSYFKGSTTSFIKKRRMAFTVGRMQYNELQYLGLAFKESLHGMDFCF